MFCPNCGAQNPDGSAFCQNCGARLAAAQQPQQQYQPQPQYQPRQQYQPQPQYQPHQPQYQYQPQAQPKKKGGILKIVLVCVVVAVLFGVVQALLGGPPDGGSPKEYRPSQSTPSADSVKPAGGTSQESQAYESWLLEGDSGSSSGTQSGGVSYRDYTTYDLPNEADFDWFYDRAAGTVNGSVPNGAEPIRDSAALFGGWKCFVMRRPTTAPIRQYWNIDLSIAGSEVACMQSWSGQVEYGGEFTDLSTANSNPLSGSIDQNCVMELTDDYGSKFTIIQWYSLNGKQYGVGTYECGWDDEDTMGLAAVCRP